MRSAALVTAFARSWPMDTAIVNGTLLQPAEKIDAAVVLISDRRIKFTGQANRAGIAWDAKVFHTHEMSIVPDLVQAAQGH